MATDEIYEFTINTPALTSQANPLITPIKIPTRIIRHIEWRVPAGSLGVMGWRISMGTVPIIPRNAGGWIVAHSTSGGWDLANQPDSGDWSVTTYNTGNNAHQLYVTLHADVIRPKPAQLALIDAQALTEGAAPDWTGDSYGA